MADAIPAGLVGHTDSKGFALPLSSYTGDQLPALLDFVETSNSWGAQHKELGRRVFQDKLGQPGLSPQDNCLLWEEGGRIQGYVLVFPEPPISRAVLEFESTGGPHELDLVRWGVRRARQLEAEVVHLYLPEGSPKAETLKSEGFAMVRRYWTMVCCRKDLPEATMPEGFSVRQFHHGDLAALTEIQNAAFEGSWGFSPNTLEQIRHRTGTADTSPAGILLLKHGDKTVGYCWTNLIPVDGAVRGVIGMIGLSPDYRAQGISSVILVAGMEYLRAMDAADIRLEVDESNVPARRLYTWAGFEKVQELHWFELGSS